MKEITFDTQPPIVQTNTISEAFTSVMRDPAQLFRNWNYKGAVMSGTMRAPIFFITYLIGRESLKIALAAAFAQFAFRFVFAGLSSALIQKFRRVEPAWKALLAVMILIPAISHVFEFIVQYSFAHLTHTGDHTEEAILRSISISIISALFGLFAMRRDVMIVGEEESKSMWSDLKNLPRLIFIFVGFIPMEIAKMLRRGAYLAAGCSVLGFGVFAQILGWAVISKPLWTYNKGKWTIFSFWGIDGMILLLLCLIPAMLYLRSTSKSSEELEEAQS
ncbi:MAG: hypothetical protein M3209_01490 [Acidobacteriota bacterium]|nr:hypothetical protein [Acidobacteriota bacterium]